MLKTTSWGPGGAQPWLGYVDDAGVLAWIAPTVVAVRYEALDAVAVQNARTSIWLTRNDRLVPGQTTSPAFVYQTAETHFGQVMTPSIAHDLRFTIGAGAVPGTCSIACRTTTPRIRPRTKTKVSRAHSATPRSWSMPASSAVGLPPRSTNQCRKRPEIDPAPSPATARAAAGCDSRAAGGFVPVTRVRFELRAIAETDPRFHALARGERCSRSHGAFGSPGRRNT
jgi:hypothetical protein